MHSQVVFLRLEGDLVSKHVLAVTHGKHIHDNAHLKHSKCGVLLHTVYKQP